MALPKWEYIFVLVPLARAAAKIGQKHSDVWLSELIWREFFMQILWNFPHVQTQSFRPQYDKIAWRTPGPPGRCILLNKTFTYALVTG